MWLALSPGLGWTVAVALTPLSAVLMMLLNQQGLGIGDTGAVLAALMMVAITTDAWILVAVLVAFVAMAGFQAWRCLGDISRHDLLRAARGRTALTGGAQGADTGLVLDLVSRRTARNPHNRLHGLGRGRRAVAWYDVQRAVLRQPWLLIVGLVVVDLGCVTAMAVAPSLALWPAVVLMPILAAAMTMRRVMASSSGARRNFPAGWTWDAASCSGAATVALVNSLVLAGLLIGVGTALLVALAVSVVLNGAALAGALRLVSTPPPDFATGLVMTEAGAIPLGAILTAARGWDVVVLVVLMAGLR
ncbi:hypothetical protein GCM10027030_32820 [Luteococcus sediminum]